MSKFKLGALVRHVQVHSRSGLPPRDTFEITRVLPSEKGVRSYRIKSAIDGHERVAAEDELEKT
jgi:hypothetical protein